MSLDSAFAIHNRLDIMRKLNTIWQQGCLITVSFNTPTLSFLTAITDIDSKQHTFSLDIAPKDYLTQQLLAASEVHFSTNVAGIQVRFTQTQISTRQSKGKDVISVPLPSTLYWLEKRLFYRIKSPISNPANCNMEVRFNSDTAGLSRNFNFKLYDMSISGIALMYEPNDKIHFLRPNSTFDNCHITLPEIGDFYATLEIRNQRPLNINNPDKTQLVGAQFISPSHATEAKTQRYMQWIERENIKIKKDT